MYRPKIFLFGNDRDNLVALEETGYVTESALQEFLAEYPDLLPGDQIDPENPRRWLLVAREMGVPAEAGEAGRWSLDHLFLDQDGIPTFVECKRASDTRARREVVAQMLDYAANALEYWSVERLRQAAAETAKSRGGSLDQEITRLLGVEEADIEGYWEKVEANLREHRVRLVFVTDSTPRELRRLVEFLNEEMSHVEVLVVEIKQFQGAGGRKALVPRVVGLTESARNRKEALSSQRRPTNYEAFMGECAPEAQEFFQRVLDLAEKRGYIICWGMRGFSVRLRLKDQRATFVFGFPPNVFQFYFDRWIREGEEFLLLREQLLAFGLFRESGEWTLSATVKEENLAQMKEVYDFILAEIEKLSKAYYSEDERT
ncbi:MAG: hypothetical protein K6U74_15740 [Firmicutes bacterium]|nr:hypothetical protein [Bacillota bacterium]